MITSFKTRFEHYNKYEKYFHFSLPKKLKEFDDKDLKLWFIHLEGALKYDEWSNNDANKLYPEIYVVDKFLPCETINLFNVLNYMKKLVVFLMKLMNIVLVTILVIATSAETCFSKLMLLMSYLGL